MLAGAMRMTAPTAVVAAVLVAAAPAATHAAPPMPAAATTHGAPSMPAPVADDAPTVTPESAGSPLASPPPTAPREKGRWYGWELILSDTLFLLVANDRGHETALGSAGLPIGLVGIVAAPPALHLIHGNNRRAAFGLLVRGVTVGLYAASVLSSNESSNTPCPGDAACVNIDSGDVVLLGLTLIAVGGAITYVFIDDFFFSRVPVAAPPRPRATVVPTAYLRPGGGGLGLVGTF